MTSLRNYIEELTSKVDRGQKAGKTVADLQKSLDGRVAEVSAIRRLCQVRGRQYLPDLSQFRPRGWVAG